MFEERALEELWKNLQDDREPFGVDETIDSVDEVKVWL